jgi:hypothetical protein
VIVNPLTRRAWLVLLAIAAIALVLRLAHEAELTRHDLLASVPAGDEHTFVAWAHRVAEGHDDAVPYQAPLYPTVLGALERVVREPPLGAARLLQALLGLVTAGVAACLALEITRRPSAAVATFLLAALARPLIHAEGTILRESASAALLATLALAFTRARARGPTANDHFGLGLALGLGLVLRENFAVVALVVLLERAFALTRPALPGKARALAFLALALGAALPVLPYDLKVARLGGGVHPLPHWNSGCVFYLANRRDNPSGGGYMPPPFVHAGNPEGEIEGFTTEAEKRTGTTLTPHAVGAFWLRQGLTEIAADPLLYARRVLYRAFTSIVPWETVHQRDPTLDAESSWVLRAPLVDAGVLVALALVGILAVFLRGASRDERSLLLLVGAWWASMLVAAFTTRYRVPVLPLLAVLSAIGAAAIVRWIREARWIRLVAAGTLILVLAGAIRALRPPADVSNALRTRALAAMDVATEKNRDPQRRLEARQWFHQAALDLERARAIERELHGSADIGTELLLGEAALEGNAGRLARDAFTDVTARDPVNTAAWRGLGRLEYAAHRPHAAVLAFEKARALAPADASVAKDLERARAAAAARPDAPP